MQYVKLETSDGEERWINLAQVSRVTSAVETGSSDELVVVFFSDPRAESTLKLHGSNDQDRAAIRVLKSHLDVLAHRGVSTPAAVPA